MQALCHAALTFDLLPAGFLNGQLRARLASLLGIAPGQLTPGRMTYLLRGVRLHGLIQRVPHSHRYRLTSSGLRVALFFARRYDHLLRPGLGAIMPALSDSNIPFRRSFDQVEMAA